jgi:hypothetical protein
LDWLTAFGLFAVTGMLVFYALEELNPGFVLAFAAACAFGSLHGFLQGAWPFGLVEAVWSIIAVRRWRSRVTRSGCFHDCKRRILFERGRSHVARQDQR